MDLDLADIRSVKADGMVLIERVGDRWLHFGPLAERLGPSKPYAFEDDLNEMIVTIIDHLAPHLIVLEGEQRTCRFAGDELDHLRAHCLHDEAS